MKTQTIASILAPAVILLFSLNAAAGPNSEQWRRMKEARLASQENPVELTVSCRSDRTSSRRSRRGHAGMYHANPYRWNDVSSVCRNETGVEVANGERRTSELN